MYYIPGIFRYQSIQNPYSLDPKPADEVVVLPIKWLYSDHFVKCLSIRLLSHVFNNKFSKLY